MQLHDAPLLGLLVRRSVADAALSCSVRFEVVAELAVRLNTLRAAALVAGIVEVVLSPSAQLRAAASEEGDGEDDEEDGQGQDGDEDGACHGHDLS